MQRCAIATELASAPGKIGEPIRHFRLREEILVGRELARPPRIGEHLAVGDAHARLVRAKVLAAQELHRVRRHDRQRELRGEANRRGDERVVIGVPGALHLEIAAAGKGSRPPLSRLARACRISLKERRPDFAAARARERDEALGPFVEPLVPHFRPAAILIRAVRARQPFGELQISGARLREQQRAKGLVALGVVRQPDVAAEDRLDPVRARRLVELDEAERVREIGDRERRHRVGRRGRDRVGDAQRPVGDRKFAVQTQMDESGSGHGLDRGNAVNFTRIGPRRSGSRRRRGRPGKRRSVAAQPSS